MKKITWIPDWLTVYSMHECTSSNNLITSDLFAKENNCTSIHTRDANYYTCTEEDFIIIKLKYPNIVKYVYKY